MVTATAVPVEIAEHFDNRGTTTAGDTSGGAFNIWGNTFPAEELPAPGSVVDVGGMPFLFRALGPTGADNMRCSGQALSLPPGRYDWIHVLAAAERRTEDTVVLRYRDGSVDREWLRVSDFWPETPARFGEREAFRCTAMRYPRHTQRGMSPVIWHTRISVPRQAELTALRLPDNPAMHVFAMTLAPAQGRS